MCDELVQLSFQIPFRGGSRFDIFPENGGSGVLLKLLHWFNNNSQWKQLPCVRFSTFGGDHSYSYRFQTHLHCIGLTQCGIISVVTHNYIIALELEQRNPNGKLNFNMLCI